jgi:hypothetical protein
MLTVPAAQRHFVALVLTNTHTIDFPALSKELLELLLRGRPGQVAHEHSGGLTSRGRATIHIQALLLGCRLEGAKRTAA